MVKLGVLRLKFEGPSVVEVAPLEILLIQVHIASVEEVDGVLRVEVDGFAVLLDGFLHDQVVFWGCSG